MKAVQQAGIMSGKTGNKFDPQGSTTRAEASAILRRFAESAAGGAKGWVQTSGGQWQYIRDDYMPVTGWLTTRSGNKHWFDKGGFLYILMGISVAAALLVGGVLMGKVNHMEVE